MNETAIDIEALKRKDEDQSFDTAKYSVKVQRKIRKMQGLSFADQLKKKFREKNKVNRTTE